MKQYLVRGLMAVALAFGFSGVALAGNNHNQTAVQVQGQEQDQYQKQGQLQAQVQGQESVGSVDVNNPRPPREAPAFSLSVGEADTGATVSSPLFGAGTSEPSEQKRVAAYLNAVGAAGNVQDPRVQEAIEQLRQASKPCRLLGFGPQRWGVLGNALCWADKRDVLKIGKRNNGN